VRVLDVGCGTGIPPVRAKLSGVETLIGVDIDTESLIKARTRYPARDFVCCRAETLPFTDASFDRVVSSVAIPYTDIPRALSEIRRILRPEGTVFMSVHYLGFSLKELRAAFPRPAAMLFRLYVIANGVYMHFSGKTVRFLNGRTESFQTKRGMMVALGRAGFKDIVFSRPDGRLIVEATVARISTPEHQCDA
jgi:ubiquinone/menaquinone biosynthesis C-methylase UbiE